ncbi:kinase-like domain-containing protein [Obelidium mucronatum]|nr:kinase-like domain-containing protein [Obelidium mucronatum]
METSLYQRLYPNYQDAAASSRKRDNSTASFADRIKWITQVAVAMKYLHHGISGGPPVLHLNLKPDNILIDAEGNARISDIGISRHPSYIQTQSRQPNYLFSPPESFSPLPPTKYKPTPAFDVYSFAMTVYQVLSGQGPFDDVFHASVEKVGRWVVEGYRPPRPSTGLVPAYCWALIEECWDQEPGDRPGFTRILEIMQTWK